MKKLQQVKPKPVYCWKFSALRKSGTFQTFAAQKIPGSIISCLFRYSWIKMFSMVILKTKI